MFSNDLPSLDVINVLIPKSMPIKSFLGLFNCLTSPSTKILKKYLPDLVLVKVDDFILVLFLSK